MNFVEITEGRKEFSFRILLTSHRGSGIHQRQDGSRGRSEDRDMGETGDETGNLMGLEDQGVYVGTRGRVPEG